MSFTDVGKSYPSRRFLAWQICFNAIRENKILTKISEFTVPQCERKRGCTCEVKFCARD